MSMFSEIPIEHTVHSFVRHIQQQLQTEQSPEARAALKETGRFALTQFDWSTPDWAREFDELFQA